MGTKHKPNMFRASRALRHRTPMIKFPDRRAQARSAAAGAAAAASNHSSSAYSSMQLKPELSAASLTGAAAARQTLRYEQIDELPARYRMTPISDAEMEAVMLGGANLV